MHRMEEIMTISWLQAALLGLFACLASMPGMCGSSVGNYTFGRPLIGGFICGLILGDMTTGILVGCAMQVVYIALVTPGGTVSADVRAVSYIGIPLGGAGYFFWRHGRHPGNRIVLRDSHYQSGMAAYGLAGRGKKGLS